MSVIDARTGYTQPQYTTTAKTFKASDTQKVSSLLRIFTVAAIIATMFVMSGFIH